MKHFRTVCTVCFALFVLAGCRYPEGPGLSFHDPEYRIVGFWQITHTYLNGTQIDSTASTAVSETGCLANNPGTYYYIYADYILQVMAYHNGEYRKSTYGNWYFEDNYRNLVMRFTVLGKKYSYTASVKKLSRREMIFEYTDEQNNEWRIVMNSRSSY